MIENVTCQFSDTDKFVNLLIPVITIISSLLISLFVVVFAESYKRKQDFENLMNRFGINVILLDDRLKHLKIALNLGIVKISENPKNFDFHLIDFPIISLTAYDEFVSKGYWKFVLKKDIDYLGTFKDYVDELSLAKIQYDQIVYLASMNMQSENFNDLRLSNYNRFIKSIDDFNEKMKHFETPKYQSFFNRVLNSIKRRFMEVT